ncbi:tryptophan--tRNA ligase [Clostridia bacterium]|nr:tryptophan--tRNA ligase [Clostridia bacterium]
MAQKIVFSGIQPSGSPQLGNYLGALRNWVALQEDYSCRYCIVDMHSITVRQSPEVLEKNARDLLAFLISAELDYKKHILYAQSHVRAHAQLAWILSCFTYMGELSRMTQFKDKSQKHEDNINAGLFTYPVLMAADILLFGTELVPIGEDQTQHLELSRTIAARFNNLYGDVFKVPEAYITRTGTRVMGLQEPTRKMSKSDDPASANVVYLLDEPKSILNKFKRAVTDSDNTVRFAPEEKPGISNLINIYSAVTGKDFTDIEKEFEGAGYGKFKTAVAEAVISELEPIIKKYNEIRADAAFLDDILKEGAQKADAAAEDIMRKAQKAVGFISL